MKKTRLFLWKNCNKNCEGCCNKDWDLANLPYVTIDDIKNSDEILLTGGEPMLYPNAVLDYIRFIREVSPKTKIYVYTADVSNLYAAGIILGEADGMTVTIHKTEDVFPFVEFSLAVMNTEFAKDKSCRLNIFKGIELGLINKLNGWDVKYDIEWIPDCPLPKDEVFLRAQATNILYKELHPIRNLRLHYDDKGPDELGRRHFTLDWERYDPTNMFKQEISSDGYVKGDSASFVIPHYLLRKDIL